MNMCVRVRVVSVFGAKTETLGFFLVSRGSDVMYYLRVDKGRM